MRCIELTGSDNRMDCQEMFSGPFNTLPTKCNACGFPDLDFLPQPYYLAKSKTMSPQEMAPAENGNFFVRDRIRKVLEQVTPSDIAFFPTCYKGTRDTTPWHLAVPKHKVVTAKVNTSIHRCDVCGEPKSAHPGSQYSEWLWSNNDSTHDILKSSTWASSEFGWDRWVDRSLYMSVRLFSLLKKMNAKGLDECTCGKATSPDKDETNWIKTQLNHMPEHGLPLHAPGTVAADDAKWFRQYLKDFANNRVDPVDWKSLEKAVKFKFPKTYKDFIDKSSSRSFKNVDQQEGLTVHLLLPKDLNHTSYRAGAIDTDDSVDGVMFASSDNGDCFCFDVREDRREFEVFHYLHEYGCFDLYAQNFAAFIRRLASVNMDA